MAIINRSFEVPYRDQIIGPVGLLTRSWEWFFRSLMEAVTPLGVERSFQLTNNQSDAADITGMKFDAKGVSQATVEYLVQRVTSSSELIESGIFIVTYNPDSEDWNLESVLADKPDDSGVTFSIDSNGQVQYTSSNVGGTIVLSRIIWRARTLSAKSSVYSTVGAR